MKGLIKGILLSIVCMYIGSCQTKEKQMEELIQETYSYIKEYKTTPVYSCQVNKYNCRLIIEIERDVDYRFVENNGESMMLPLNSMLVKSGMQKAIIKVYPFEGEEYIDAGANIGLTFYYAPDKDSNLSEYQKITTFSLPKDIGEQKLPYYEAVVEFEAKVPFDYSEELVQAKNLKQIPDIEEKVVAKFNQLREICVNLKDVGYRKEILHRIQKLYNAMYVKKNLKFIGEKYEKKYGLVNDIAKNREFLAIENYDIQYYADGKIVALWQKNLKPILYMKGEVTNSKGETRIVEGGDPIFLYMPKGSEVLKLW